MSLALGFRFDADRDASRGVALSLTPSRDDVVAWLRVSSAVAVAGIGVGGALVAHRLGAGSAPDASLPTTLALAAAAGLAAALGWTAATRRVRPLGLFAAALVLQLATHTLLVLADRVSVTLAGAAVTPRAATWQLVALHVTAAVLTLIAALARHVVVPLVASVVLAWRDGARTLRQWWRAEGEFTMDGERAASWVPSAHAMAHGLGAVPDAGSRPRR